MGWVTQTMIESTWGGRGPRVLLAHVRPGGPRRRPGRPELPEESLLEIEIAVTDALNEALLNHTSPADASASLGAAERCASRQRTASRRAGQHRCVIFVCASYSCVRFLGLNTYLRFDT